MNVLPACVFMHHKCTWCVQRSEGDMGLLESQKAVEMDPGPLQEQPAFLATEPPLQPPDCPFITLTKSILGGRVSRTA